MFPVLQSERLTLRRPLATDCDLLFQLRSDPEVNKFIGRDPPKNVDDILPFLERITKGIDEGKSCYWIINLKNSTDLVGTACLWNFSEDRKQTELGYEMMPAFQGKGYMNEAVKAVINYAFHDLHVQLIEAFTHHKNLSSLKLLEKNGFHLNPNKKDPDVTANVIYSLQNTDWKK